MQSCKDCPSFLPGDDLVAHKERFNKSPGTPMCGRYGIVLGTVKSTPSESEAIWQHFATECDAFGQPLPDQPLSVNARVAEQGAFATGGDDSVKACGRCVNCVDESTVYNDLGWAIPLCKAKGTLIFKPIADARDCPFAEAGSPAQSSVEVTLRPMYKPGFRIKDEVAVKAYVSLSGADIDPEEYPTDMEVSDELTAQGVRALRRITDGDTGTEIFVPIFDPSTFNEDDRALIPVTGGKGNPELYIDYNNLLYDFFVDAYILDETPALVGPPGVGKTQFGRYAAWLCQVPFRRIQFFGDMDVTEVLGATGYSPDVGTHFEPGILPIAWQANGGILDLDEPNLAPDPVTQVLRPVTDNAKELIIEGHTFPRGRNNWMYMSMNPSYDMRNLGTKEMADADTNRLSFLDVGRPPEAIERAIVKSYCKALDDYDIPDATLDTLMAVALDIRGLEEEGQYPGTWATRQMIKVARKTRWHSLLKAIKLAALNNMAQEVRDVVMDAVSTNLPDAKRDHS